MQRVLVVCIVSILAFMIRPQNAISQGSLPDVELAYQLATASYCAYTIGELEYAHSHARAVNCLNSAAAADPKHLAVFDAKSNMVVEAHFDSESPQDAYLLIREERGVILAFRGTLAPPLSPSSPNLAAALANEVVNYNLRAGAALKSFAADWLDNIKVAPTSSGRHSGFEAAWERLFKFLSNDCRSEPTKVVSDGLCSRFLEFIEEIKHGSSDRQLFITGHSKGGAVATLATLDLPQFVGLDTSVVTYTFEAPKSLTFEFISSAAAANVSDKLHGIWRFEYQDDLVPLIPLDKSSREFPLFLPVALLLNLQAYTHVGSRLFLAPNEVPISSDTMTAELPRIRTFFDDVANLNLTATEVLFSKWAGPDSW